MAETVIVYPKPGVVVHLPGGGEGFAEGPVPMDAGHAAPLIASGQVMTAADWQAANAPPGPAKAKDKAADPAA